MGPCKELLRNFKENTEEQELEPVLYCTKIGKCTLWHRNMQERSIALAGQTGTSEADKRELPVTGKQEAAEALTAADSRKVAISVKNLYKIYRVGEMKVRALDGVDFEIYKGEFVAIVGTSGSGKSTLLNMLAGLEKPTKGEIEIGSTHIEKMTEKQLVTFRRERVGFIFQSYNLLNTMNAVENVALPLSFRGVSKRNRLKQARKFMDLVGVGDQARHMPNQMSGGQQQRVGIARALVVNPQIIFADEPTGNLDSRTTMEVLRLMQKIVREQGQTLVMVTHDNNLASYADRRIRIVDGKIVGIETGGRLAEETHIEKGVCENETNENL